ncbi:hypothetical protein H2200_006332 [Cladophialophora chaetospira]|uniref:FAD-binding PCMH-type domain-containing protein n=1 Tax=Cladophialophora chaetospira TaxID=386627 RepID=A0AA39CJA1_9EURO|nr:hypothetical protein H2200_006332 [Cladophialophora chaetospira]
MLGGGHGFLQGQYGLLADQLINARIILGNGTIVTASKTSHADLFWAIRGAGHNFGIVTEYTLRVYDAQSDDTWAFQQFIFAGKQLDQLYTAVNTMKKSQPAQVVEWGFITRMPVLDPVNPVIIYTILYDGPLSVAKKYSAPIRNLSALQTDSREVPYLALPGLTGNGGNDIACQKGATLLRFPIYLESVNVTALQQVYDAFDQMMVQQPAFNNSFFLVEGYSVQGVQKVPADSTAFPHRGVHMLLTPVMVYLPDAKLDVAAVKHGQHLRELLLQGSGSTELKAYVNYAHGDESLGSMYGFEPWRLDRLRKLKKLYDPEEKFSFYAPIH